MPDARCPRCGAGFHCGVDDAAACGCTTVTLPSATLAALRAAYTGCLCVNCLQALQGSAGIALERSSPRPPVPEGQKR